MIENERPDRDGMRLLGMTTVIGCGVLVALWVLFRWLVTLAMWVTR